MKVQVYVVPSNILGHSCLGHPSNHVLSILYKDLKLGSCFRNNKVDVCEVCFHAK